MDTAQTLATVIGSFGGGAVVLALVNGLIKWLSGAASRERSRNTSVERQRIDAVEERDAANDRAEREFEKRRKEQEYAAMLRALLIENGIKPYPRPLGDTEETEPPRKKH